MNLKFSEERWKSITEPLAKVFAPGIRAKHFAPHERDKAIRWLKKKYDNAVLHNKYLSKMNVEKIAGTNIYSFEVDGTVDEAGINALQNIFKSLPKGEKIKLMAGYKKFSSAVHFKIMVDAIKLDFEIIGKLEKYAIVSEKKWIDAYAESGVSATPGLEVNLFTNNEKDRAIEWLKQ